MKALEKENKSKISRIKESFFTLIRPYGCWIGLIALVVGVICVLIIAIPSPEINLENFPIILKNKWWFPIIGLTLSFIGIVIMIKSPAPADRNPFKH